MPPGKVVNKKGEKKAASKSKPTTEQTSVATPPHVCPICSKSIQDADKTSTGQDALFCEGECQCWLHRWCAGVTRERHDALSSTDESFICPACTLANHQAIIAVQQADISTLRECVNALMEEVKALKGSVATIQQHESHATPPPTNSANFATTSSLPSTAPKVRAKLKPDHSQSPLKTSTSAASEAVKKFNIVVFGVTETTGSSRFERIKIDFREVSSILTDLVPDSPDLSNSIRDCKRLGKYLKNTPRPRPILVTLNSTVDVSNVLSNRHRLHPAFTIKPDLPPVERRTVALLLKERWKLMELGTDRRNIRIRGSSIYLCGQMHGKVTGSTITTLSYSSVDDPVPQPPLSPPSRQLQATSPGSTPAPKVNLSTSTSSSTTLVDESAHSEVRTSSSPI